ncbi:MAG: class I SAM-dependent methyltransferase [Myxococcota bacterium]
MYDDPLARDRFFLFLQNVYRLYPESAFHQLILETTREHADDEAIYRALQARLPALKAFLSEVTYGLPALRKQKREMAEQTAALLGEGSPIRGYVEIGTTGRYVNAIRSRLALEGPVWVVNDVAPGYSPNDLAERGQLGPVGEYVALGAYDPFDERGIAPESVELVSNFIGFHHAPPERRARFVEAAWRVLAPGGRLVVRDHDVDSEEMDAFVALAHDVFNAGLAQPWARNAAEIRHFTSIAGLEAALGAAGFERTEARLFQAHDPTRNALMVFTKPATRVL